MLLSDAGQKVRFARWANAVIRADNPQPELGRAPGAHEHPAVAVGELVGLKRCAHRSGKSRA
jgi:hypothetical protein